MILEKHLVNYIFELVYILVIYSFEIVFTSTFKILLNYIRNLLNFSEIFSFLIKIPIFLEIFRNIFGTIGNSNK